MKRPVIIGFGNPLRGDDGVGPRAAELLEAELGDAAEIIVCHQLTPELVVKIGGAQLVIFLDASADQPAGAVSECSVTAVDPPRFTHHLTPGILIGLGECMGADVGRAVLLTCGAADFDTAERLSSEAESGARKMAERARELVRRFAQEDPINRCN